MDPVLEKYIGSICSSEPQWLSTLLRDSYVQTVAGRMNSGHVQGRLLKMLAKISGARRVLELGTFCGYSALCLAEGLSDDGTVVSIEIDDEKEDFIRSHIEASPYAGRIDLRIGDCEDVMRTFADEWFDMVFIDADKRRYPQYLDEVFRLLRPGGLLLADNTLWDGHVVDPRYASDPQTLAILEFNRRLVSRDDCETVTLPVRDGFTVALKL